MSSGAGPGAHEFSAAIGRVLFSLSDFMVELGSDTPRMPKAVHNGDLLLAVGAEHRLGAGLRFRPFLAERNRLCCGQGAPLFTAPAATSIPS